MPALKLNSKVILSQQRYSWLSLLVSTILHALPIALLLQPTGVSFTALAPHPVEVVFMDVAPSDTTEVQVKKQVRSTKTPREPLEDTKAHPSEIKEVTSAEKRMQLLPQQGNSAPIYPEAAKEQGIEGVVFLHFDVDLQGNVKNIKPLRPQAHALLEQAAITALKKWKFKVIGHMHGEGIKQSFHFSLSD